jgi:hypothetical protein
MTRIFHLAVGESGSFCFLRWARRSRVERGASSTGEYGLGLGRRATLFRSGVRKVGGWHEGDRRPLRALSASGAVQPQRPNDLRMMLRVRVSAISIQ